MNLGYRSHCPSLVLFVLVISLDIFFLHLYCRFFRRILQRLINGGVEQMYTEMASCHRVRFPCIQIIKTATIPAKLCKMESTKQFHNSKIKFPLVFKKVRPPSRKLKTTYKASRPNLFM